MAKRKDGEGSVRQLHTVTHDKSRKTASVPIQLCKQLSTWLYGKSLIPEDYARFAETKHEKRDEYFRDKENADKNRKQIFSDEDIHAVCNWPEHKQIPPFSPRRDQKI